MTWVQLAENAALFFTGVSAAYCYFAVWRRWKTKMRYFIKFKEFITDEPERLQAMIMSLRMANAKLHSEIKRRDQTIERLGNRR